jgi:hypothetical protein
LPKTKLVTALALTLITAAIILTAPVRAQTFDDDPVFFVIGEGSTYMGDNGWTAGYVITGSGTYTLDISATGPQNRFPVTDVKVVVCVSEEASQKATVTVAPNTANSLTVTSYTHTSPASPPQYLPPGGLFSESDYYGYNDAYTIPELSYVQIHHPDSAYPLQVTVTFASGATQDSKVMFLCYGIDAKGDPAKTPFSGGTLFVLPEFELVAPVMVIGLCLVGFGVYRRISR